MDYIEEGLCEVSMHPQGAADEVEPSANDRGLQANVVDVEEMGRESSIVQQKANGTSQVACGVHEQGPEDAVNGSGMHDQTSKGADIQVEKGDIEEVEGCASQGTMVDEIVVDISKDEVGQMIMGHALCSHFKHRFNARDHDDDLFIFAACCISFPGLPSDDTDVS